MFDSRSQQGTKLSCQADRSVHLVRSCRLPVAGIPRLNAVGSQSIGCIDKGREFRDRRFNQLDEPPQVMGLRSFNTVVRENSLQEFLHILLAMEAHGLRRGVSAGQQNLNRRPVVSGLDQPLPTASRV